MSFGENLQLLRKKNQLSQEGLAEMLGVSRQAVSKWELGEGYPEVDKLLLLSKKLNVSLDSLLGGRKHKGCFRGRESFRCDQDHFTARRRHHQCVKGNAFSAV